MTKRQSSLERLGNFKVTFDHATDQILGLVDANGQELPLVTAVTSPGGGIALSANGQELPLVTAVTSPGGVVELVADGENLNFVRSVTSPGDGTRITNMISLTQAQYDALVTKDAATLYVIVEDEEPPVVEE